MKLPGESSSGGGAVVFLELEGVEPTEVVELWLELLSGVYFTVENIGFLVKIKLDLREVVPED